MTDTDADTGGTAAAVPAATVPGQTGPDVGSAAVADRGAADPGAASDVEDGDVADDDVKDGGEAKETLPRVLGIFPRADAETRAVLHANRFLTAGVAVVVMAALAVHDGWTLLLPAHLFFALVASALSVLDARVHRLPNALTFPSYPALLLLLVLPWQGGPLLRAVLGALALLAVYYVLAFAGGAGLGDVKAAGLAGLVLGFAGWHSVLVGTVYAGFLGGLWAIALLVTRRAGRRTEIAVGPFLLGGAVLALLVG